MRDLRWSLPSADSTGSRPVAARCRPGPAARVLPPESRRPPAPAAGPSLPPPAPGAPAPPARRPPAPAAGPSLPPPAPGRRRPPPARAPAARPPAPARPRPPAGPSPPPPACARRGPELASARPRPAPPARRRPPAARLRPPPARARAFRRAAVQPLVPRFRSMLAQPTSRAEPPAISTRCRPGQQKAAIRAPAPSLRPGFARRSRATCRYRAWTSSPRPRPAGRHSHRTVQVPFSAACAVIEQKPDAPEVVLWPLEPVPDFNRARRQSSSEKRGEASNGITSPGLVRHYQDTGLDERAPSLRSGDRPQKPPFPIHGRKQVLDVGQARLDFDRHHSSIRRTPAEHVDRTALSVDRERVLRKRLPALRGQPADHRPHEQRMFLVEEPGRFGASPPGLDRHRDPQRGGQASGGSE
jgi:hypothetical protein